MALRVEISICYILVVASSLAVAQLDEPAIVTEGNGIKIQSPGGVVFQTKGTVEFQDQQGNTVIPTGLKGEKGEVGATGSAGAQGGPGLPGLVGQKGEKGEKGGIGTKGDLGIQGSMGPPGPKGQQGQVGPKGVVGPLGPKGDMGISGNMGSPGEPGVPGNIGQPGVCVRSNCESDIPLSWRQCVFNSLNSQRDYGLLAGCNVVKKQNNTFLRVAWDGNMRITRCQVCCMRWALLIDGEECSDPAPIDALIYQSSNYHFVRQSYFTGICKQAGNRTLDAGNHNVQLFLYDCPGFDGYVYDAYTGWNSISRIIVEEMYPSAIESQPHNGTVPADYVYQPNYCQYTYANLSLNRERNLGHIANVTFDKKFDHTALKITWEGNFRKKRCRACCLQWFMTIDGFSCTAYEDIRTSISSQTTYDIFFPATLSGICFESNGAPVTAGKRLIKLEVGNCDGSTFSDGASGFSQSSRFIIEEVPISGISPRSTDPKVYFPYYSHCAFNSINDGVDDGAVNRSTCRVEKRSNDTTLRLTFNGNMRVTGCSDCCARWFLTVDGYECTTPIEGVIYTRNGSTINIHRAAQISGLCNATTSNQDGIASGAHIVKVNVGRCMGFNDTFNAYTGFSTISTLTIEELPSSYDSSITNFSPNIKECSYKIDKDDMNATNTSLGSCTINKIKPDTVLKASWYGNIALEGCIQCCMRWYLTIDGQECSNPEVIDAAIKQDLAPRTLPFDTRRPAAVSGICYGPSSDDSTDVTFNAGKHNVQLFVGPCDGTNITSSVMTGYNSISRFILEEIPAPSSDCVEGVI